jgi:hypothetical protein
MEGRNWQAGMYDQRHILMLFAPDEALTATNMGDKYQLTLILLMWRIG